MDIIVQIPVSVALPVSLALNVCDVSILSLKEDGRTTCTATSASDALSKALARALLAANP